MQETTILTSESEADVISFIDEAGGRGFLRSLQADRDHEISLMCALPIPIKEVEMVRSLIRAPYDRFCAVAPKGAKLHITAAFSSDDAGWIEAANEAREEICQILLDCHFRVVYAARRLRVARKMHAIRTSAKELGEKQANPETLARFKIKGRNRPSDDMIEDRVMSDLALLLEAFMETAEFSLTDLHFDEIDKSIARRYAAQIDHLRNTSNWTRKVVARDMKTNADVVRYMHFSTDPKYDTKRVGKIIVAGKTDPLVFAVDVVANSLWRHLSRVSPDAPLNDAKAVKGWQLEPITVYDRTGEPSSLDFL
ncbi:hypothetical protein ACC684_11650 [Rhizobium ruizarguesonis]